MDTAKTAWQTIQGDPGACKPMVLNSTVNYRDTKVILTQFRAH